MGTVYSAFNGHVRSPPSGVKLPYYFTLYTHPWINADNSLIGDELSIFTDAFEAHTSHFVNPTKFVSSIGQAAGCLWPRSCWAISPVDW